MQNILRELQYDFMNASTTKEVDHLVFQYSDLLDENPGMWKFPRNARKRLSNLHRERKDSFKLQLN